MSQSWEKLTQGSLIKLQTHNADLNSTPITVILRFLHFSWKNILNVMLGFCILLVCILLLCCVNTAPLSLLLSTKPLPIFLVYFLTISKWTSIICHRSYGLVLGWRKNLSLFQHRLNAVLWQYHKMGDPLNWPREAFELSMGREGGHPCNNNIVSSQRSHIFISKLIELFRPRTLEEGNCTVPSDFSVPKWKMSSN